MFCIFRVSFLVVETYFVVSRNFEFFGPLKHVNVKVYVIDYQLLHRITSKATTVENLNHLKSFTRVITKMNDRLTQDKCLSYFHKFSLQLL